MPCLHYPRLVDRRECRGRVGSVTCVQSAETDRLLVFWTEAWQSVDIWRKFASEVVVPQDRTLLWSTSRMVVT